MLWTSSLSWCGTASGCSEFNGDPDSHCFWHKHHARKKKKTGHDYRGRMFTTIGEEKKYNARLAGKTREEFVEIMNNLKLGACVRVFWESN